MPEARIEGQRWIRGEWIELAVVVHWQDQTIDTLSVFPEGGRCHGPLNPHKLNSKSQVGSQAWELEGSVEIVGIAILSCPECYKRLPGLPVILETLKKGGWDLSNTSVVAGYDFLGK